MGSEQRFLKDNDDSHSMVKALSDNPKCKYKNKCKNLLFFEILTLMLADKNYIVIKNAHSIR